MQYFIVNNEKTRISLFDIPQIRMTQQNLKSRLVKTWTFSES